MNFDRAFAYVVGVEGGFSDDPKDPGNWTGGAAGIGSLKGTKYGISAKAYPQLDIRNLTLADAKAIYLRDYWTPLGCDARPWPQALCVFDCGVNQGVQRAMSLLTLIPASEQFVAAYQAERAMKYAIAPNWSMYGRGWMRRLIRTAIEASKENA